jgi:LCP family protein required for cell wall assembly
VNVLVAVCLVGTASAFGYIQWRLNQIHRERISSLDKGASGSGGAPFTVLIVGSDSRAALSDANDFGGTANVGGQRSDTIILARVVPASRQIMLMSIPRDLWVNIPGMGQNRINTAFDTSANLLVETIEQDLGIPINHYIEVNFDTFRDISNAVGGVSFYFPTPAKDAYSGLDIPQAGCYSLSGDSALGFVRSRHYEYYLNGYWRYEGESDLARIQRQQAFIKKLVKKAENEFTNPIALNSVIAGVTKNLTVDSGFSNSLIIELARDFRSLDASAIPTLTLPNYPFTTSGGAEVLGVHQPQAAQTIASFNSFGSPKPVTSGHPSATASSSPAASTSSPAATSAGATPLPSVTTTTIPGTNSSTYVLPGLPSGAAAPSCPS